MVQFHDGAALRSVAMPTGGPEVVDGVRQIQDAEQSPDEWEQCGRQRQAAEGDEQVYPVHHQQETERARARREYQKGLLSGQFTKAAAREAAEHGQCAQ